MDKITVAFLLSSFRSELLIYLMFYKSFSELLQTTSLVLCQEIFHAACPEMDP